MRVIKPAWVEHKGEKKNRCPIYSISVHPDGTRLATGGLDRKVKIWSTLPILDAEAAEDEANHKLLCTMSEHTGSVLAVRWAHHGRFLASGSDDAVVMIWGLDPDGGGRLWGSDEVNVENWKPLTRLVAHQADVVDIAWSWDDSMLASTGLDSKVWIWDGTTFERIRKIDQHQGFVKGVTWDPVGQYLATQSDDKTVQVWDVDTWEHVSTISEPFKNSGHATFFRRLSWSPDGAFIAASNAKNGPVFVASVIDREGWAHNISFVGHQNTIQVAAFNPKLFFAKGEPVGRATASCMLALGADDFSISIWRNSFHKPIVVLHDIFGRNLLDMCWANDGLRLYGCSEDGTICAISFDGSEFPELSSLENTQKVLDEYEYVPKRKVRSKPALQPTPQVANGFGAPSTSSAAVNILQPRKAKPGDQRKRVNLQRPEARQVNSFGPPQDNSSAFDAPEQPFGTRANDMFGDRLAFGETRGESSRNGPRRVNLLGGGMGASAPAVAVREIRAARSVVGGGRGNVLAMPKVQNARRVELDGRRVYFQAINGDGGKGKHKVAWSEGGQDVWLDYLPAAVLAVAMSERVAAAGLEDGMLGVWSSNGGSLLAVKLEAPAVELAIDGWMVLAVTADCGVRVFDARTGRGVVGASCSHLLDAPAGAPAIDLTGASVRPNGAAIIITSEPHIWAFDPRSQAWISVVSPWDLSTGATRRDESGVISTLATQLPAVSAIGGGDPPHWDLVTELGYLERRIRGSEVVDDEVGFRGYVAKYTGVLAREGLVGRADDLVLGLLGPVFQDSTGWNASVGSLSKRALAKEVLASLARTPALVPVAAKYETFM